MSQNVPECPVVAVDLSREREDDSGALSEKQCHAIGLLSFGKSVSAIAQSLGIDRRTLYRWRQDERFRFELSRRRRELWSDAADRLQGMVHPSLDILEQHLIDRYDRARFRAATAVIRFVNLRKAVEASNEEPEP
jgi:hypothetical protein